MNKTAFCLWVSVLNMQWKQTAFFLNETKSSILRLNYISKLLEHFILILQHLHHELSLGLLLLLLLL